MPSGRAVGSSVVVLELGKQDREGEVGDIVLACPLCHILVLAQHVLLMY